MSRLSRRERQCLEVAVDSADYKVVGGNIGITAKQVSVHVTDVRRKEAAAKAFLVELRPYRDVLHPHKKYKGIRQISP